MKIAILGAGAFGTALGGVLAENGHEVSYYDPAIRNSSLLEALRGSEYIVLCVPSMAIQDILLSLPKDRPLIVATKGILSPRIFEDYKDYMVLSGPGFAKDIKEHKNTKLTATDRRIIDLFKTDYLDFDYTDDKKGVLMCGALKNVYAILAGMEKISPNTDEQLKFLTEVSGEMKALLLANGARPETVDLECGIGDLRITCAPPSRNFEFGVRLRKKPNYKPEKTVEGVSALKRIKNGELIIPNSAVKLKELLKRSEKWA